jgi:hypothetical protein
MISDDHVVMANVLAISVAPPARPRGAGRTSLRGGCRNIEDSTAECRFGYCVRRARNCSRRAADNDDRVLEAVWRNSMSSWSWARRVPPTFDDDAAVLFLQTGMFQRELAILGQVMRMAAPPASASRRGISARLSRDSAAVPFCQ